MLVEWRVTDTSLVALEPSHASLTVSEIPEAQTRKDRMESSEAPGLVTRLFEEGE